MEITRKQIQFEELRNKLENLMKKNKRIHVSVLNKRRQIYEAPSDIVGIYANFLCVESQVNSYLEKFTIPYSDLLIGSIQIKELV